MGALSSGHRSRNTYYLFLEILGRHLRRGVNLGSREGSKEGQIYELHCVVYKHNLNRIPSSYLDHFYVLQDEGYKDYIWRGRTKK